MVDINKLRVIRDDEVNEDEKTKSVKKIVEKWLIQKYSKAKKS